MASHLITGSQGEDLAAAYLAAHGYTIVKRRARSGRGDIDLICRRGAELIFVEVKARTARVGSPFGSAIDGLSPKKIASLSRSILAYVHNHGMEHEKIRCDFIAVDIHADAEPVITHLPAAFEPVGQP